jgi:hypothetical protein
MHQGNSYVELVPRPAKNSSVWKHSIAAGLVVFAVVLAYWWVAIRPFYYPVYDDFALLVKSTKMFHPKPLEWFTQGFHDYLTPNPGMSLSATDFLRPVVNLCYYINSVLFGGHWANYLLLAYAVFAYLVGLTVYLAHTAMRMSPGFALLAGALSAISPAVFLHIAPSPCFVPDALGAALLLTGFVFCFRGKYAIATLLFLVAVFTKETAFYAPLAAAAVLFANPPAEMTAQRKWHSIALLLTPSIVYVVLYKAAFRNSAHVYVVKGYDSLLLNLAVGPLKWPVHAFLTDHPGQWTRTELADIWSGAALCMLFWLTVAYGLMRWWDQRKTPTGVLADRTLMTFFFLWIASLAMPALLSLEPRFGVSANIFLVLVLLRLWMLTRSRTVKTLCIVWLGFYAIAGVQGDVDLVKTVIPEDRMYWTLSSDFMQKLGQDPTATVFLVDDLSGGNVNPELLAAFAGHPGRLVNVNTLFFHLRDRTCATNVTQLSFEDPNTIHATFPRNGCVGSVSLAMDTALLANSGSRLHRIVPGGSIDYEFSPPTPNVGYGIDPVILSATIHCDQPTCKVLALDWTHLQYTYLK